jgi:hypothetical protein
MKNPSQSYFAARDDMHDLEAAARQNGSHNLQRQERKKERHA